ncbi:MAG: 30S ribosomal protein S1 [Crocinitomicaceae bacterium]|nr:30S ribosomal protein S1 [Crocinitomicaceae bacterium]|tara:strand:+ start:17137 stop:19416 length:2280 start_codon:yes stop_codon:yes gene_type:complete
MSEDKTKVAEEGTKEEPKATKKTAPKATGDTLKKAPTKKKATPKSEEKAAPVKETKDAADKAPEEKAETKKKAKEEKVEGPKAEAKVNEAAKEETKADKSASAKASADKDEKPKAKRTRVAKAAKVEVEEATAESEEVSAETEEVGEEKFEKIVIEDTPIVDINTIKPLDEFNWDSFSDSDDIYTAEEKENLSNLYNDTLTSIFEHQVIDGTVATITKKEVVVNIGYKSDGVLSSNEFRYKPDLKVGDKVEVYVEKTEDKTGQLVLSHKKARTMRAWQHVNDALETGEIITGLIKCRTKGGLIADVFGIEAFLPGSQIDVKPIRDYDQYVNKQMDFKVVKINQEFRNVVVSHKALIEAELEEQKAVIMSQLEKGQVLEGVVKNITSYGVFIDLGGVDGLIHITDLSWGRINHPEEVVELDQKINVVILDFDDNKKRIALGVKQLQAHPWDNLDEALKVDDSVKGKVVVLADYGAFVEIAPGVEGLIHVSEMSWGQHLRTAQDFFKIGDEVEAKIMTLDREERKMSLSTRQLTPDPWEGIEAKYPVGTKVKGKATNLSNFGVFVELEEGVDGLIHISDLSWSKKVNHPSEFTKAGEEIEAVVLEIDKDNRRLSLGHKQLEENPWDVFETVFTEGSVHEGTLLSLTDKGGLVGLPYGVEGFAPGRHLVKEDGSKVKVDEKINFLVLEFNKDSRKIIVSHSRIHEGEAEGKQMAERKSKKAQAASTRKAVKDLSSGMEKSTLGDLDALSALKASMEKEEKKK